MVERAALEGADLVLAHRGVALAIKGELDGFCGTAFAVEEDLKAMDISPDEIEKNIRLMSRQELLELVNRSEGSGETGGI